MSGSNASIAYLNIGKPTIARIGMMIIHQMIFSAMNLIVRLTSGSEISRPFPAIAPSIPQPAAAMRPPR